MGTLHEDIITFMTTSCWILLRMRNVADKSCNENQNTHLVINNFSSENRAIYEMVWKNLVELDRPQMIL